MNFANHNPKMLRIQPVKLNHSVSWDTVAANSQQRRWLSFELQGLLLKSVIRLENISQ